MVSQPIHGLRTQDVYSVLETSPDGLTVEQVEERRNLYGANTVEIPPDRSGWSHWIRYINHPMAWILWLAGIFSILLGRHSLGIVIFLVVIINASFSWWREYRAQIVRSEISSYLPRITRVVRNGAEIALPASELVPGDVVVLGEGDNIPADGRVIQEVGLRVNNACLTGEAVPARKTSDASNMEGQSEIERTNLIFAGTSVVAGTCRAVIYATGMQSQLGRIANLTQSVKETPAQLQVEMAKVSKVFSFIALGLGVSIFISSITDIGQPMREAFTAAIGVVVATLPEGLVPTVTLALAVAAQRLAQQGVLVKKLSDLETLGKVSVLCSDKSGTLTQNQMTVRRIWTNNFDYQVSGNGYNPQGEISLVGPQAGKPGGKKPDGMQDFILACMLCNNARVTPPGGDRETWTSLGDQTEAALLVLGMKAITGIENKVGAYPRIHEIPFDARRKRMSTIYSINGQEIAYIKGAPKEVLQLCTHIRIRGEIILLDQQRREKILATNDAYARQALRVLALAEKNLEGESGRYLAEQVEHQMVFLGLAAMMDPPRPDVAEAIEKFKSGGIRLVMITGDYGLTAVSLGQRIGMFNTHNPHILTGADLDEMNDAEIMNLIGQECVFARMAPDHKMRVVSLLQEMGDVVGVIGDGVNDAPALRKADVGIAMGVSGTDAARDAADIILLADHFGLLVKAIEEGRAVYDNLRKFITYIFASNVPEVLPFIIAGLFNVPLALTAVQVLAIDLGTDIFPALALGIEKPEPDIMSRPPRKRNRPVIDRGLLTRSFLWLGLIEAALCYLGFFLAFTGRVELIHLGLPQILSSSVSDLSQKQIYQLATTVFFAGVVTAQIGNVFACRSERGNVRWLGIFSNPYLIGGIIIDIGIMITMIYFRPLAEEFGHFPIPTEYWIFLLANGPILYGLERLRKQIRRKRLQRQMVVQEA